MSNWLSLIAIVILAVTGQTCDFIYGDYILVTSSISSTDAQLVCAELTSLPGLLLGATFVSVPPDSAQNTAIGDLMAVCGLDFMYVRNGPQCGAAYLTGAPTDSFPVGISEFAIDCTEPGPVLCAIPSTVSTSVTVILTDIITFPTITTTVAPTDTITFSSTRTVAASTVTSLFLSTSTIRSLSSTTSTITIPTQTVTVIQTTSTSTFVTSDSTTQTINELTTESVTDTIIISELLQTTEVETIRSTVCPA